MGGMGARDPVPVLNSGPYGMPVGYPKNLPNPNPQYYQQPQYMPQPNP